MLNCHPVVIVVLLQAVILSLEYLTAPDRALRVRNLQGQQILINTWLTD